MTLSLADYRKLVHAELGIELGDANMDGLGELSDPDRLTEFCGFSTKHRERIHPIQLAESLDQVLGSLSEKIEHGNDEQRDYEAVLKVVRAEWDNPWSVSLLQHYTGTDIDPTVDPGDHAISLWLRNQSDIDPQVLELRWQSLQNDPSGYDIEG